MLIQSRSSPVNNLVFFKLRSSTGSPEPPLNVLPVLDWAYACSFSLYRSAYAGNANEKVANSFWTGTRNPRSLVVGDFNFCCSLIESEIAAMAIHHEIHKAILRIERLSLLLAFQPCPTLGANCRSCRVRAQGKVKEARLLLTWILLFTNKSCHSALSNKYIKNPSRVEITVNRCWTTVMTPWKG